MTGRSAWVDDGNAALLTDLYQLTMLQAYLREGMTERATFNLFVRRLPRGRNFLVAAGLDDALRYLESVRFSDDAIEHLRSLGRFDASFLDWLRGFRFTGDVDAMPEGTVAFENEPLVQVVAPIAEAQLVETFLMNQIHLQTTIASKAARVVLAAAGRRVVDFALRRSHGADAAMKGARAMFIAGVDATSNVLAGRVHGIPVAGTMAHSYVQAHDSEAEAFRAFVALHPDTVLLVDTYDTLRGVEKVVHLSRELVDAFRVTAVRLDSGDLATLARQTRRTLDEAGLASVGVFASGSLDEWSVRDLVAAGAPIDGFGVGTRMGVSSDAPSLDTVYKLLEYAGTPRMKLAPGKMDLPGRKQVFRADEGRDSMHDVIAGHEEERPERPLLIPVMRNGRRLPAGREDLATIRERARRDIQSLPARVRALDPAEPPYRVETSAALRTRQLSLRAALEAS